MAVLPCPECGGAVSEFAGQCPHCGCPVSAIMSGQTGTKPRGSRKGGRDFRKKSTYERYDDIRLKGLGGWLILVGIGLVLTPIIYLVQIWIYQLQPLIDYGQFFVLFPALKTMLICELLVNLALFVFSLHVLALFFKMHHLFPQRFIIFYIAGIVVILLDFWAVDAFLSPVFFHAAFDGGIAREFLRELLPPFISGAIWIPYMLMSRRVKMTFVVGEGGVARRMRRPFQR